MAVTENWPAGLPGPSDENLVLTEEPRVRATKFGDGYEQRSADGLNSNPQRWSLQWPNLKTSQKDTIINFLRARAGWEPFNWTPPKLGGSIKVKGVRWSTEFISGGYWSVSATFEQVFDL